ncbi:MAG: bifunctional 2-C-methyl-D-erythritol 4-phosphate cytidylyltransferase/2-C-methyl-D-erythritol 2,4-cyclodiphosphate synthase [Alphaproteobacteria bacterium]
MKTAALIVAAGRGERAGGGEEPKQYRKLASRSVLVRSLLPFLEHPEVEAVQVVIAPAHDKAYADDTDALASRYPALRAPVHGADDRQGSVRRGLEALNDWQPDQVLIHDAARPFVSRNLIDRVLAGLRAAPAVIPASPVVSTLKRLHGDGTVGETVARDGLVGAETPQGFRYRSVLAAHRAAAAGDTVYTDDAAVVAAFGEPVSAVEGDPRNIKITTTADMTLAQRLVAADDVRISGDVRVGHGFDVHAFGPGDHVMLGGVAIEHGAGLSGHSDADVILHALTDAVLGALADGDIGSHFPPSDAAWRDAESSQFLAFAAERVTARGGVIAHLDATLVGEAPKVSPHRDRIRARIAEIAGIDVARVAVKATTNEGMGFIGRREGLAAHATATLRLPFGSET